jgi:hypothetical protein
MFEIFKECFAPRGGNRVFYDGQIIESAFLFVEGRSVTSPPAHASKQVKARMPIHNFFKEYEYEQTR